MATTITSDCINCGACEPECPNTAIYSGAAPWEFGGAQHPALAQDIFYIVPQKCTECVGFHDHEACAAVCPVDCCIPDPKNVETHEALLARARELHPELTIGDDAPSRFHKEGAAQPAAAASTEAAPKAEAAPKPAAAAPAPKPVVSPAPVVAAAPAASVSDEEFDPGAWEVPIICKDCASHYTIPYRHFQAGVVFYCPQCSGSFVPTSKLCKMVRDTFEGFFERRKRERESMETRQTRERVELESRQATELDEFEARLQEMAAAMKPAGKLVRPKGIAAMFT